MYYIYGMRFRPAGPGCQPKGFVEIRRSDLRRFYNYLVYKRQLTDKEINDYELEFLGTETKP